jgi:hypothetical protein
MDAVKQEQAGGGSAAGPERPGPQGQERQA